MNDAFDDDRPAPCARCTRMTPPADLTLWTETERLRTFCARDQKFRYLRRERHYAVCWRCRAALERGGGVVDLHTRRGVVILLSTLLLAAVVAALTPYAMPALLSAFWQTR